MHPGHVGFHPGMQRSIARCCHGILLRYSQLHNSTAELSKDPRVILSRLYYLSDSSTTDEIVPSVLLEDD